MEGTREQRSGSRKGKEQRSRSRKSKEQSSRGRDYEAEIREHTWKGAVIKEQEEQGAEIRKQERQGSGRRKQISGCKEEEPEARCRSREQDKWTQAEGARSTYLKRGMYCSLVMSLNSALSPHS